MPTCCLNPCPETAQPHTACCDLPAAVVNGCWRTDPLSPSPPLPSLLRIPQPFRAQCLKNSSRGVSTAPAEPARLAISAPVPRQRYIESRNGVSDSSVLGGLSQNKPGLGNVSGRLPLPVFLHGRRCMFLPLVTVSVGRASDPFQSKFPALSAPAPHSSCAVSRNLIPVLDKLLPSLSKAHMQKPFSRSPVAPPCLTLFVIKCNHFP